MSGLSSTTIMVFFVSMLSSSHASSKLARMEKKTRQP
jgi:hypothetical protein